MADDIEKDANLSLVELDKGETLFTFSQITHHHSMIHSVHSHSFCQSQLALYYQLSSAVVRLDNDDLLIDWEVMNECSY